MVVLQVEVVLQHTATNQERQNDLKLGTARCRKRFKRSVLGKVTESLTYEEIVIRVGVT